MTKVTWLTLLMLKLLCLKQPLTRRPISHSGGGNFVGKRTYWKFKKAPNGMVNSDTLYDGFKIRVDRWSQLFLHQDWARRILGAIYGPRLMEPGCDCKRCEQVHLLTCFLTKIARESFLLWSSIWTGATERSTLPVWRIWLTRKGKRVITAFCEVPSEERRHQSARVQKYVLMFWALGNGRYRAGWTRMGMA